MIAPDDFIEGLAKGLAVLESFDPQRQRLNASQVAQRTGLSRAAARRQLLTLAHLGYLDAEDGNFGLSPRVLRLAGAYLSSARLPRVAQPVLDRLALATREACSVVVLDRAEVVIVARSLGTAPLRWQEPDGVAAPASTRRGGAAADPAAKGALGARQRVPAVPFMAYGLHQGARLAAHATSTGRMLLACLTPPELDAWLADHGPLPRFNPNTVTDPRALRSLLRAVRKADHCVAHEAHERGVHAVAVPVRDLAGRAVAALNIVTSPDRLTDPALTADLLEPMRAAARDLQERL